jgi:hypothetical protein
MIQRNINKEPQKSPCQWIQPIIGCLSYVIRSINVVVTRICILFVKCNFLINICFCLSISHLYMPVICFLAFLNSTDWLVAPKTFRSSQIKLAGYLWIVIHPATIFYEINEFTLCRALIVTTISMIKFLEILLNIRKELHSVRIFLSTKEMICKIL